jgi:hypothetical protein
MQPYEVNAFIEERGTRKPFYLRVSEPTKTPGEDDYHCLIHAPNLFERDKKIFGVSEEQAQQLALEFVKQMLGERRVFDKSGNQIKF